MKVSIPINLLESLHIEVDTLHDADTVNIVLGYSDDPCDNVVLSFSSEDGHDYITTIAEGLGLEIED